MNTKMRHIPYAPYTNSYHSHHTTPTITSGDSYRSPKNHNQTKTEPLIFSQAIYSSTTHNPCNYAGKTYMNHNTE